MTAHDLDTIEQKPAERSRGNRSKGHVRLMQFARRYFLMSEAIQRAKGSEFRQTDCGYVEYTCAKQCLDAIRRLEPDSAGTIESIAILRGALHFALDAWRARRGVDASRELAALWPAFSQHPDGKETTERLTEHQHAMLREFIRSAGLLTVAPLTAAKRSELGDLLNGLVEDLVGKLDGEALALSRLRTTRVLRLVFIPTAIIGILALAVFWLVRPNNVALHKAVQLSTVFNPAAYPGPGLVDGDKEHLAVHTQGEPSPWAQIDLGGNYNVRRVVVDNRKDLDGRSIPLDIETSLDGVNYTPFAHRETPFKTWNAKAASRSARYVRLIMRTSNSLQLSEVEVY